MNKAFTVYFLYFLTLFFTTTAFAQTWQKEGERLTYNVKLAFVPAGEAEIAFSPNLAEQTYQVINRAWTYDSMSSLFKLKDRIQIEGNMKVFPFASTAYAVQLNENTYKANKKTEFDHKRNQAVYKNIKDGSPARIRKFPTESRDLFSALYFLRHSVENISIGDVYSTSVMDITRNYTMHLKVLKKEKIRTPFGTRNTFVMQVILEGLSEDKKEDNLFLWISDDADRLPLQFKLKMKIGSVTAKLKQVTSYANASQAPASLPETGIITMDTTKPKKREKHENLFDPS